MNTIPLDEAIARARQWRAEASCSPAAAVAIALLNSWETLQDDLADIIDAERYRHLRNVGVPYLCGYVDGRPILQVRPLVPNGLELDVAVDNAIAKEKQA